MREALDTNVQFSSRGHRRHTLNLPLPVARAYTRVLSHSDNDSRRSAQNPSFQAHGLTTDTTAIASAAFVAAADKPTCPKSTGEKEEEEEEEEEANNFPSPTPARRTPRPYGPLHS